MNYSLDEIKKMYKNIQEDFGINYPSTNIDTLTLNDITEFYKKSEKNRKRAVKEKISQIPYFAELVDIFGKEAAYRALSKTSLAESVSSTNIMKKALLIERCIKQKIPFLESRKMRVILMGQKVEETMIYIYIDEKNYIVTKLPALINADWEKIKADTTEYYQNMDFDGKINKLLNNPITQLISLQLKQIV